MEIDDNVTLSIFFEYYYNLPQMKKTNPTKGEVSFLQKCHKCGKNIETELREGKFRCFHC